ncbi:hypothetical protein NM688_g7470 [Phlebia brevispora]|uniref:Uncharacterized protein n=1 Tax=Phlebia brevispora TaxID=194682 RepID=A0ACC1S4X5_9APHY|nr:hypothetical protein NM688_g7470 [Phlebia brevispora]
MPPVRTTSTKERLAVPRGPWILRTKAREEFDLAPSDLESILPIEVSPNPHGGPWPMKKYNWCDVRDLAERLRPRFGLDERAEEDGEQIARDTAKGSPYKVKSPNSSTHAHMHAHSLFRYGQLWDCQMDRIRPTSVKNGTTYYNRKDVEELAERIKQAAANPTGRERPANYRPPRDFNVFDNISLDDADDWLYRFTGIVAHPWNEDEF